GYQKQFGLAVDGIAGPDTFAHLGLHELILLKTGTSGEAVKKLQRALGLAADGQFGPATEKAVRDYQQKNGLAVDGMAGPQTLARLQLFTEITEEIVERSQVPASMVEAPVPAETPAKSEAPTRRSIWDTVKSFFGRGESGAPAVDDAWVSRAPRRGPHAPQRPLDGRAHHEETPQRQAVARMRNHVEVTERAERLVVRRSQQDGDVRLQGLPSRVGRQPRIVERRLDLIGCSVLRGQHAVRIVPRHVHADHQGGVLPIE
ncbi:MAG: peptidoglycan-binding domain-containing protein, partial [Candidatus Rokuibacteriota bacterium]